MENQTHTSDPIPRHPTLFRPTQNCVLSPSNLPTPKAARETFRHPGTSKPNSLKQMALDLLSNLKIQVC